MIPLKPNELRGSYPPMMTPFKEGQVDYRVFEKLVERQIDKGSHGILVNGTTAEPSTLSVDERNELVSAAMRTAAGRIPVIAATGSQSLNETLRLTEYAHDAGVAAILVVTPYYSRPPQRGLVAYFDEVARVTSKPLLMYHIPARAAVTVACETLCEIASKVPNFVGMKHASTDFVLLTDAIQALGPEFRIFGGIEELSFPMLCAGACGLMNAVGNLSPGVLADLCRAVAAGDLRAGRQLHEKLWKLNRAIFYDVNPIPLKYMMRSLGLLTSNEHRLPMCPPTTEVAQRLDSVLANSDWLFDRVAITG
jgi:4-hydroxy-tetrahydrodipicolinate synthase